MTVNKVYKKFVVDDGADRSIVGIEGKSISRKSIYSSEDKTLPLPWRKGIHYNQPALAGPLKYSTLCLTTGLCCWEITLRKYGVSRSALVRENLFCWAHA